MSIINDALKKTQEKYQKQKSGQNISDLYAKLASKREQPGSNPQEEKTAAPKWKSSILTAICVVFLLGGAFTGVIVYFIGQNKSAETLQNITKIPKALKELPIIKKFTQENKDIDTSDNVRSSYRPKPLPQTTYTDKELILNGTMLTGEKRVALINNEVFELDDKIYDKTIINIDIEKVELRAQDGQITTLTVKRF